MKPIQIKCPLRTVSLLFMVSGPDLVDFARVHKFICVFSDIGSFFDHVCVSDGWPHDIVHKRTHESIIINLREFFSDAMLFCYAA